mgnify:CR=1 FL=1
MTSVELRAARKNAALTQEALARRLGVSWITVQRWESSHSPISEIAAIAIRATLPPAKNAKPR